MGIFCKERLGVGLVCFSFFQSLNAGVVSGEPVDCVVYTLDGARAGSFTCMPSEVGEYMERNGFRSGMYMVKMTQGQRTESRKVTID